MALCGPKFLRGHVLLDQRLFSLDDKQFQDFLNLLNEPPGPTEELGRLLTKKAPWETS